MLSEVDRERRVIYAKLTERGGKLAQYFEEIGIEKDLGIFGRGVECGKLLPS